MAQTNSIATEAHQPEAVDAQPFRIAKFGGEVSTASTRPGWVMRRVWLDDMSVCSALEAGTSFQVDAGYQPSKLQRPVGDRVKTDARDALHLAQLLKLDEIGTGCRNNCCVTGSTI